MVVAGRAGAGNTIEIILDDKVAETLTADAAGEFATVLDGPLSAGAHTLSLIARNEAGVGITGKQTVAIEIPGDGKAPLVVVQDENKPPQIVQAPEPDQPASGGDGSGSGTQVAAAPPPSEPAGGSDQPAGDNAGSADQPATDGAGSGDASAGQASAPEVYIRAFEVSPADVHLRAEIPGMRVFSTESEGYAPVRVIDHHRRVRVQRSAAQVSLSTARDCAEQMTQAHLQSGSTARGRVEFPGGFVLYMQHIIDLCSVDTIEQATSLVQDELGEVAPDTPVILIWLHAES